MSRRKRAAAPPRQDDPTRQATPVRDDAPDAEGPPTRRILRDVVILAAVFGVVVGIAELAGAANLGVAFGIGQIAFAAAVIVLLTRA
jgi:hypothetical protein